MTSSGDPHKNYKYNFLLYILPTTSKKVCSTVQSPSLVISNAAGTDEGLYICMASNSVGTGQSQQTFLDVVGSSHTYIDSFVVDDSLPHHFGN
jgi:hypothetical protein